MSTSWSLQKELCELTGTSSISEALNNLNILKRVDKKYTIRESDDWIRAGSETYIYYFWVRDHNEHEKGIVIKACVAFAPGLDLENILKDWISRRRLLSEFGVSTPILYTHGNGLIIEEFISYRIVDLISSKYEHTVKIIKSLSHYAAVLDKLGFTPINPFVGLRSRGDDVVVIDFGQDLGSPGIVKDSSGKMFEIMVNYLGEIGISINDKLYNDLREIFDKVQINFNSNVMESIH